MSTHSFYRLEVDRTAAPADLLDRVRETGHAEYDLDDDLARDWPPGAAALLGRPDRVELTVREFSGPLSPEILQPELAKEGLRLADLWEGIHLALFLEARHQLFLEEDSSCLVIFGAAFRLQGLHLCAPGFQGMRRSLHLRSYALLQRDERPGIWECVRVFVARL